MSRVIKTGNLLLENILRPIPHQIAHCFLNFFISYNKWRHPLTFHDKELLGCCDNFGCQELQFPRCPVTLFLAEELPWKIVATNALQYL